jgi:hypothetical protein
MSELCLDLAQSRLRDRAGIGLVAKFLSLPAAPVSTTSNLKHMRFSASAWRVGAALREVALPGSVAPLLPLTAHAELYFPPPRLWT